MITEIPSPIAFQTAGLNQLYLAWQIAMQAIADYEEVKEYAHLEEDEHKEAAAAYWEKSQPALANAFGLIQQAMEMALKGRIASVSPFLLIARDPATWPAGVDSRPVAFSEFRTLDAADLIKVLNAVSDFPLNAEFKKFWHEVRRDRNKIMHSVTVKSFQPATLVRILLTVAHNLFADIRWPQRLLDMEANGKYAAYGLDENQHNIVMNQISIAISYLTPALARKFFDYSMRRRSYLCPHCYDHSNQDWQWDWPRLAQFKSRLPRQLKLHCIVCDITTEIERASCSDTDCRGDVIYDNKCLTCLTEQDSPGVFRSNLDDITLDYEFRYMLQYRRTGMTTVDERRFPNDDAAVEHARLAMSSTHLLDWRVVTVTSGGAEMFRAHVRGEVRPILGSWVRQDGALKWLEGESGDTI